MEQCFCKCQHEGNSIKRCAGHAAAASQLLADDLAMGALVALLLTSLQPTTTLLIAVVVVVLLILLRKLLQTATSTTTSGTTGTSTVLGVVGLPGWGFKSCWSKKNSIKLSESSKKKKELQSKNFKEEDNFVFWLDPYPRQTCEYNNRLLVHNFLYFHLRTSCVPGEWNSISASRLQTSPMQRVGKFLEAFLCRKRVRNGVVVLAVRLLGTSPTAPPDSATYAATLTFKRWGITISG
jgi:hypothetical protein